MKDSRQKVILDLIAQSDIGNQSQLMAALESVGIKSTQATISRDIKQLHLVKEITSRGTYRYVSSTDVTSDHLERLHTIFKECVTSMVAAQNIVVIKTLPGLASAACSTIDQMNIEDLAGTLAGDDTAFLAMKDVPSAERFCRELKKYL